MTRGMQISMFYTKMFTAAALAGGIIMVNFIPYSTL